MSEKISNENNNTNNINIKVDARPKRTYTKKKKEEPNWYVRTIVGGIIALLLSAIGYYIKNSMENGGSKTHVEPVSTSNQIQPN